MSPQQPIFAAALNYKSMQKSKKNCRVLSKIGIPQNLCNFKHLQFYSYRFGLKITAPKGGNFISIEKGFP